MNKKVTSLFPYGVLIEGSVEVGRMHMTATLQVTVGPFETESSAKEWQAIFTHIEQLIRIGDAVNSSSHEVRAANAIRALQLPLADVWVSEVSIVPLAGRDRVEGWLVPADPAEQVVGMLPQIFLAEAAKLASFVSEQIKVDCSPHE